MIKPKDGEDFLTLINAAPKRFADGMFGGFNKSTFFFAVTSGEDYTGFATTVEQMKVFYNWLKDNVERYEKEHGVIELTGPVISPFQIVPPPPGGDKKPLA